MKNKELKEPDYEENITHYNQFIFGLMRKLAKLKSAYQFLIQKKKMILIFLLIFSILC